ncbi:MAG: type I restriction endonuclease subunit R [Richelia sp. RM2_1_2]|nr:type I restriction endonuclease subunit R [Richelia sp. SM1_7_0]NJN13467.1 type I restriction endonuclease subunit R [Richelia sp. RM1_1_1]NJO26874.1 type I restriction endonuclease subunit R [Richelia sp. SL_2_1]NJO58731.1 type I restriction endonuclease subunit R [Richelia sp. RM2_1_2]
MTLAVTDRIKSFKDLLLSFKIEKTTNPAFFSELSEGLQELSPEEKTGVGKIKKRFDYHREDGFLLEGTVNLLVVSPLLELAGFLDEPYQIRSPFGIEIVINDTIETLRGFIDTLVVNDNLWVLSLESKRSAIPVGVALPQLFAYMLAQPRQGDLAFGIATNGDEFIFLKLDFSAEQPTYDFSRAYSLLPTNHELGQVLKILKRLGSVVMEAQED